MYHLSVIGPRQNEDELESWRERWADSRIGFHLEHPHTALHRHASFFAAKSPNHGSRVLVPLCGKTLDMWELSAGGFEVVGCDLSPIAAQKFFEESKVVANRLEQDGLTVYQSAEPRNLDPSNKDRRNLGVSILVGDFFTLPLERFAPFELIWDRAALVALPPSIQADYVAKLRSLLHPDGRLVLVTLEYDSTKVDGPPFPVTPDRVRNLYGSEIQEIFCEEQIESAPPSFVASGVDSFIERTWLLGPKK